MTKNRNIARVFRDTGGYHVCDDSESYLDARGSGYDTKADALRAAYRAGYTHATGSGTYRPGVASIRSQVTPDHWDQEAHERALAEAAYWEPTAAARYEQKENRQNRKDELCGSAI